MCQNAERFQMMLAEREDLRERINEAVAAYDGDQNDDRAVFDAVIAPVARSIGIELTYDEAREAALDGRDLTDEELELVVGGGGVFYRKLVSGVLAATLVFGSVPARAFAEEGGSASTGAQTEQVLDQAEANDAEQAALDAIESYDPDISGADIAVPEGIEIDGADVYYTDAASDMVKNAAIEAGIPYEDEVFVFAAAPSSGGDADEESDVDKGYKVADKTFEYTNKALGFVSKDAQDVLEYDKKFYELIKSCMSGDFEGIFGGVEDFLSLMGVIDGGGDEAGPSSADLMAQMKDLNDMVGAMRNELSSKHAPDLPEPPHRLRLLLGSALQLQDPGLLPAPGIPHQRRVPAQACLCPPGRVLQLRKRSQQRHSRKAAFRGNARRPQRH